MSTLTRNLPWFIRDLGVSIIGQECYTSLVEDLEFTNVECLRYSLSKGLGIGIVVGGSVMKVPQLILIVRARSARGISLPAYVMETMSYAITLAYSFRNGFPFSTYGENLFLTIQNIVITLLIVLYAPSTSPRSTKTVLGIMATTIGSFLLYAMPSESLSVLQISTLPLSLFSKLPQIRQNARAGSTGQLSAFAVVSQIGGCAARLFTNATETRDSIVGAGFAMALLLNIVLGVQLWMYWGSGGSGEREYMKTRTRTRETYESHSDGYGSDVELKGRRDTPTTDMPVSPAPWHASSPARRVATPPPRTSSASGARKWARKVD